MKEGMKENCPFPKLHGGYPPSSYGYVTLRDTMKVIRTFVFRCSLVSDGVKVPDLQPIWIAKLNSVSTESNC